MDTIHVLFLKTQHNDFFLNRLTAWLGGTFHGNEGFCHVEVCVPHPQGGYISSSIYNGEKVSMTRKKTFANPGYVVHSMLVTRQQVGQMQQCIQRAHENGVGFDGNGMFLAALPVQLRCGAPNTKTFCSRYVTEVLQAADVQAVDALNPNITTPSKLYSVLRSHRDSIVAGSVEHKQQAMRTVGSVVGGTQGHAYMKLSAM